jgi:hypothetical protein
MPQHQFLVLNVSVENAGTEQAAVPFLSVRDSGGKEFMEVSEGDPIPDWLGSLRLLAPARSERGKIFFDVPMGTYRLMVKDAVDPERENTALIDIPLQI